MAFLMSSAGHYDLTYTKMQGRYSTVEVALDVVLIPVRRKRLMEYSTQGSALTVAWRNTVYSSITALHATVHAFCPYPEVIYMSTNLTYTHLLHMTLSEDM